MALRQIPVPGYPYAGLVNETASVQVPVPTAGVLNETSQAVPRPIVFVAT